MTVIHWIWEAIQKCCLIFQWSLKYIFWQSTGKCNLLRDIGLDCWLGVTNNCHLQVFILGGAKKQYLSQRYNIWGPQMVTVTGGRNLDTRVGWYADHLDEHEDQIRKNSTNFGNHLTFIKGKLTVHGTMNWRLPQVTD